MIGEQLAKIQLDESSWRGRSWTGADLENIFEQQATSQLLILLTFSEAGVNICAGELQNHIYLRSLVSYFGVVQKYFNLRGQVLLSLNDGAPSEISSLVPILSFGKLVGDKHPIIIPDPYYLDNLGYQANFAAIDNILMSISRENRSPMAYWRGSSTGGPELTPVSWHRNLRVRLCFKSKEIPELLDARITRIVQAEEEVKNDPLFQSIVGECEPLERNIAFRIGIDIDGNANAWGLIQKLYMDLATIKVKSQWMQWYYPLLEDNKHVLYIDPNLNGLQNAVTTLRDDDSLARQIAENARGLARELDYSQAVIYAGTLLEGIFPRISDA